MALLKFLKGNYASLNNAAINEGQVLICGDTGEMFVDVAADKRVKIGDFVVMSNLTALEALDASAVPTSRLYYVEDGNILARSNGTSWIQINKQKTLAELGGVSKAVYDEKMTALTKADTDNATAIEGLKTFVGTIPNGDDGNPVAESVIAYVNKKTDGIATSGNLEALGARVTTAEGEIDVLQAAIAEGGSVATAIATAKAAGDAAQADVDALELKVGEVAEGKTVVGLIGDAQTQADKGVADAATAQAKADEAYNLANGKATMTEVNEAIAGAGHAVKADVDTAIENLGKAYVAADEALETKLQGNIDKKVDQTAYDTKMTELAGADTTLQGNIDALAGKVGTVPEGSTVMGIIANIQENAYDDTEVRGLISDNADAIAAEKERAEAAEAALQEQITTNANAIEVLTNGIDADKVDGVKELIDYVDKHGAEVTGMKEDIADNAKAISDHEAFAAETYETKEDATSKKTEIDGRLDVLEGKVDVEKVSTAISTAVAGEKTRAEAKEAELAQADATNLQAAKDYADDAVEALGIGDYVKKVDADAAYAVIGHNHDDKYDAKGDAATAQSAAEAKAAELDTALHTVISKEIDDDVAAAIASEVTRANGAYDAKGAAAAAEATAASALSAAKTELEGKITSGDVATLASAETKAAELDATLKTELQGKIDLKANSSDVYTKTETFTKDEVNALFTWGNF